MTVHYHSGQLELLDEIKPLWEALNQHHAALAVNFTKQMGTQTFETRHKKFSSLDLDVFIQLARVNDSAHPIGYIIVSLNKEKAGEIDSLYVDGAYRGYGIGDVLMENGLSWLKENGSKVNRLSVAEGNEQVIHFYKKHGFDLRFYVMEER